MKLEISIGEVRKHLRKGFESLNFKYYGGNGGVRSQLYDDAEGWISWSAGHMPPGRIDIMLHVGVNIHSIENLIDSVVGEEDDTPLGGALTLRKNLNYLVSPNAPIPWYVSNKAEMESALSEMVKAVEDYGLPFMHQHMTVKTALPLLEGSNNSSIHVRWRRQRLAALVLLGRKSEARRLARSRSWIDSKQDGKTFEQILEKMIANHANGV